jgi:repressor LexA
MAADLTDRERDTYDFIRDHVARLGYAPKLQEIAQGIGIRSRGTVHRYLQALQRAGLIDIERDRARGIRLRAPLDATPGQLPFLGRINAGQPLEAVPDAGQIDLSEFFMGPGRFVLKVQGDSMIEDGILDGDLIIIEQRETARDGEIIVALIDNDDATLKRFRDNRDGSVTLVPANAAMRPMRYGADRVRVQGVLVAQLRSYR